MKHSFLIGLIMIIVSSCFCSESNEIDFAIRSQLERLRDGGRLDSRASAMKAFLNDGKLHNGLRASAVERIVKAIQAENEQYIRSQAWKILLILGKISDNKYKGALLRDEEIIKAIINSRLRDRDGNEPVILMYLSERVPKQILHKFDKEISSLLKDYPDRELYQIIAKGKCYSAKPILEKYLQSKDAIDCEDSQRLIEISLAALGDDKFEDKFVNTYKNEKDYLKKAEYVKYLAWIGTEKTLRILAEDFRTSIIYETKRWKQSLRIDIQYALIYNFPEEELLRKPIRKDEDYANVEKFLEQQYSIKWKTERPPFFTNRMIVPIF